MFGTDSSKCNGCGDCVDACSQQAITIHNDLAVINQELCIQCGTCAEICPAGAIGEVAPAYAQLRKGGKQMPFGRGWFGRGGWGRGNPYPFCRFYPCLLRRQWATPYPRGYAPATPYMGYGYPYYGQSAYYPAEALYYPTRRWW